MAKAIVTSIFINGLEIKRREDMTLGQAEDLIQAFSPKPTSKEIEDLVAQLFNETNPDKDIIAKPKPKCSIYSMGVVY